MSITIESRGRRHYLRGNTYAIRDALRSAGAHWDRDERAWWTGQRDVAERFVAASSDAAPDSRPVESLSPDSEIVGKARYQGREYLLVWIGETRRGRAAKLAYRDGSRVFWASASDVQITRTYQSRECRGRRQPGMTLGRLTQLREEYAAERALPRLVGAEGEYSSQYDATRSDRTPGREIGTSTWLRDSGRRIAVVLVGYAPAQYVSASDAEDQGHYGQASGYYGMAYYRAATPEEYTALQGVSPRVDGVCVGGVAS